MKFKVRNLILPLILCTVSSCCHLFIDSSNAKSDAQWLFESLRIKNEKALKHLLFKLEPELEKFSSFIELNPEIYNDINKEEMKPSINCKQGETYATFTLSNNSTIIFIYSKKHDFWYISNFTNAI